MAEVLLAPSILLNTSECSADDASRFVPLFQLVWNNLPDLVKRILHLHWQSRDSSPFIRLHSFGMNSAGNTRSNGHDLRFNVDLFNIMPEGCGPTAIAHELGHILFLATEEKWHTEAEASPGNLAKVWACELINLELTRRWGYEQDDFSKWINCDVSFRGPYLRATKGEPPREVADYEESVASLTIEWARQNGIEGQEQVDRAYRDLIQSHEPYYRMATSGGVPYEPLATKDLSTLATLLRSEGGT